MTRYSSLYLDILYLSRNTSPSFIMVSKGGKAAISVVVILIVLATLAWWKRWYANRSLRDLKSMSTEESQNHAEETGSYMTSDFNNLGLSHSKLNVHRCTSGACLVCNPPIKDDAPGVFFVKSQGSASPTSVMQDAHCNTVLEDPEKAEDDSKNNVQAMPDDARVDVKKRRLFSFFQRKPKEESEVKVTVIPATEETNEGGDTDVVEIQA